MKISDPTLGTLVCAYAATHSQCRSKNQVKMLNFCSSDTTIQGQRFPSKKMGEKGVEKGRRKTLRDIIAVNQLALGSAATGLRYFPGYDQ